MNELEVIQDGIETLIESAWESCLKIDCLDCPLKAYCQLYNELHPKDFHRTVTKEFLQQWKDFKEGKTPMPGCPYHEDGKDITCPFCRDILRTRKG